MAESEIVKPSLTQRRKITGQKPMSIPKKEEEKAPPMVKEMPKIEKAEGSSDDISIVKVVVVIVAVIVVAVIAAFLIIKLQSDSGEEGEVEPTPEVTETPTPTVTATPTVTPSVTATPTVTPTVTPNPGEENLDNEFGQSTQYLTTDASGASIKIRTYQWINTSTYYEFALPVQAISGDVNIPNAEAKYNDDGDLVLEVSNISSFASCTYLNEHNDNMAHGNVEKVSCEKVGDKYVFTVDIVGAKTDFKLTTGMKEVSDEEVDAVILQVND